ncbi:hypothetical protein Tco_1123599 [Tanacetum coccineum]|uniref:Uncharacterized protein n=1 Tax=Tanacetum coccineum TaxID=301880 RepID=A0ABQ5J7L1_9ASTR
MSGGHFISRLADHFRLLIEKSLRGRTIVVRELGKIDLDELARLHICESLGDVWTWVAPRPERQPIAMAGALGLAEGASDEKEGDQAVFAPVQAPQPPPAARTMPQRLAKLDEEVHRIQVSLGEHREVMDAMARDLSRRKVRQRTGEASTLAVPLDEDQPGP